MTQCLIRLSRFRRSFIKTFPIFYRSNWNSLRWRILISTFSFLSVPYFVHVNQQIISVCINFYFTRFMFTFSIRLSFHEWEIFLLIRNSRVVDSLIINRWLLNRMIMNDIFLLMISIPRYLAVTQPLNYSRRRRSKKLAMMMILVVWVLALAITCPPILGTNEIYTSQTINFNFQFIFSCEIRHQTFYQCY